MSSDLKYLQNACNSSTPFVGAIDLGHLAKERQLVKTAKCGLHDLCASVLGKRLNKNVSECISTAWEDDLLTDAQIHYAALDAYASLKVYCRLAEVPLPQPLPPVLSSAMPVLLFGDAKSHPIARGVLSSHQKDKSFDGINLTPTRAAVDIEEVYVPAAIVSTHRKMALCNFGSIPFTVVCLRSHLRVPGSEALSLMPLSFGSISSDESHLPSSTSPKNSVQSESEPLSDLGSEVSNTSTSDLKGPA